jgi:F0F1-type ATP synthase assembly protein I
MGHVVFKLILSALIIAVVTEVATKSSLLGGLIKSLPLISILSFIWLWRDTHDVAKVAALSESTFWFVLPTLPMFLVFPYLLRLGVGFEWALAASCAVTFVGYSATFALLQRFTVL